MQAKDVTNADFCASVRRHGLRPTGWTNAGDIATDLDVPLKIVFAKARKLIRQGFIDGCPCGCRGDFELTKLGQERYPQAAKGRRT